MVYCLFDPCVLYVVLINNESLKLYIVVVKHGRPASTGGITSKSSTLSATTGDRIVKTVLKDKQQPVARTDVNSRALQLVVSRTVSPHRPSGIATENDIDVELSRPRQPVNFNLAQLQNKGVNTRAAVRSASGPLPLTRETGSQMKYPPVNSCPICNTPIPMEASSQDAFARHVDECLLRVTREVPIAGVMPSATPNPSERMCPVCNQSFPDSRFTMNEFQQHVNEHFDDRIMDQFVVLNK